MLVLLTPKTGQVLQDSTLKVITDQGYGWVNYQAYCTVQVTQLNGTVVDIPNTDITWSCDPNIGSIAPNGTTMGLFTRSILNTTATGNIYATFNYQGQTFNLTKSQAVSGVYLTGLTRENVLPGLWGACNLNLFWQFTEGGYRNGNMNQVSRWYTDRTDLMNVTQGRANFKGKAGTGSAFAQYGSSIVSLSINIY